MEFSACEPVADRSFSKRAVRRALDAVIDKRIDRRQNQRAARSQALRHSFQGEGLVAKVGDGIDAENHVKRLGWQRPVVKIGGLVRSNTIRRAGAEFAELLSGDLDGGR